MTGHPCGHGRLEGGQGLEQPGWANEAFANEAFANLLKDRLEPSPVYLPVTAGKQIWLEEKGTTEGKMVGWHH